jgi:hypothetical protein
MSSELFTTTEKRWLTVPIQQLGLTIAGRPLESILGEFAGELEQAGLSRVRPVFYLSTDWGVNFGTVAVGIPFYLASPALTQIHAERGALIEGSSSRDILRYLRQETGHVVNYAYRLYERPDWTEQFGDFNLPYEEEYIREPFSRRFVRHLPGWYAQKHPDEDWAETFAVWMTPGLHWRTEYADWPVALGKLLYCARLMTALRDQDPPVTAVSLDEDVADLGYTIDQYYGAPPAEPEYPRSLEGALRAIFEDLGQPEEKSAAPRLPASELIRRIEQPLVADVYRWTGHFPERTRPLLRYLARRADHFQQVYPQDREQEAVVSLTTLVTTLAMNHVHRGSYLP